VTLLSRLEHYFEFSAHGTNWRTEILAGLTTFLTMAYIIVVNPAILSEAGMPQAAVMTATCLTSALGCFLMGGWARYPLAMAPGMGLNAYFTYAVVKGMGVSWQTALGAVFVSGALFLLLTALGVRQMIVRAIPRELYAAVACGIGVFIALIGLRNAGIIVPNAATMVGLGKLTEPNALLALGGILFTGALLGRGYRAAMLIGISAMTLLALAIGVTSWKPVQASPLAISETFLQLDVPAALQLGALEIIFVFLFVDLFDNLGTLLAVGSRAGLFQSGASIPRIGRVLTCDSLATMSAAVFGTSTVVGYIESAAGVAAGGRTGITAITTGLCFLASLLLLPLATLIPGAATAPALILVGAMMMSHAADIRWQELHIGIPAFLTLVTIPLSFSIATGIALGFLSWTLLALLHGRWREVDPLMYLLSALFLARFLYLGSA
jgi:adenine/guanine/hypoxanthine permease